MLLEKEMHLMYGLNIRDTEHTGSKNRVLSDVLNS